METGQRSAGAHRVFTPTPRARAARRGLRGIKARGALLLVGLLGALTSLKASAGMVIGVPNCERTTNTAFTVEREVPETVLNTTTRECPPENLMIQRFDHEGRRQNVCLDLSTNCSGQVCRFFDTTAKVEKYRCVSNRLIIVPLINNFVMPVGPVRF